MPTSHTVAKTLAGCGTLSCNGVVIGPAERLERATAAIVDQSKAEGVTQLLRYVRETLAFLAPIESATAREIIIRLCLSIELANADAHHHHMAAAAAHMRSRGRENWRATRKERNATREAEQERHYQEAVATLEAEKRQTTFANILDTLAAQHHAMSERTAQRVRRRLRKRGE